LRTKGGAKKVYAFATHGLFNGKAFENIKNSSIERIIITNSIPPKPGEDSIENITRLTVGM
jgi:ribose-phosphate pyrophosphokinase